MIIQHKHPLINFEFYENEFKNNANWGAGEFEKIYADIDAGKSAPAESFSDRAGRIWRALTEKQKTDFVFYFDYFWLGVYTPCGHGYASGSRIMPLSHC